MKEARDGQDEPIGPCHACPSTGPALNRAHDQAPLSTLRDFSAKAQWQELSLQEGGRGQVSLPGFLAKSQDSVARELPRRELPCSRAW